jgi:hypothetical protein
MITSIKTHRIVKFLELALLRYAKFSALFIDAPARKLTGALFSQSAPCHPPNARAEAVATHRKKILRLQIGSAGGTANGKATAFKRAASVDQYN